MGYETCVGKILQIIPATGYIALYADSEWEKNKMSPAMAVPVICWALVENDLGDHVVVGMGVDGNSAALDLEGGVNFVGYEGSSKSQEELSRLAINFIANKKKLDEMAVRNKVTKGNNG